MKKTIAILLVAVLAVSSVFASVSGKITTSAGYNLDTKEYGFFGTKLENAKFTVALATDGAETEAPEDGVYASIKATFNVNATIGKDKLGTENGTFTTSNGSWLNTVYDGNGDPRPFVAGDTKISISSGSANLVYNFVVDEAKVFGSNWYVSIKGTPDAPAYAKSFLDLDDDGKLDDDMKVAYFGANGLEAGYEGYKVGLGFHGKKDNGNSLTAFVETPEYTVAEGTTVGAAATFSHRGKLDADNDKVGNYGAYWAWDNDANNWTVKYEKKITANELTKDVSASVKAAYATDLLSAKVSTDVALKNLEKFDMDVNANVVYDFLTVDAYWALDAKSLHAQVKADLNSFDVPVAVTLGAKNILADSRAMYASASTTVGAVSGKLSGEVALSTTPSWKVAAEGSYNYNDVATLKASVSFNDKQHLGMSISAESTTLIPGATLAFGWYDAADLLKKNDNMKAEKKVYVYDDNGSLNAKPNKVADHTDFGVIKASCTIAF